MAQDGWVSGQTQLAQPKVTKPRHTQSKQFTHSASLSPWGEQGKNTGSGVGVGVPREEATKFISPLIWGKGDPCGDKQLSWRI